MEVQIRGLSGQTHTQVIDPGASVQELLQRLPSRIFVSNGFRLFHKGVALEKSQLLSHLHLEPTDFLTAIPKKGKKRKKPECTTSLNCDKNKEICNDSKTTDIWQDLRSEVLAFQRTEPVDDVMEDETSKNGLGDVIAEGLGHGLSAVMPLLTNNLNPSSQQSAKYRLPVALERLNSAFKSLSILYRFLTKNYIQTTWLVVRDALRRLCQDKTLCDDDLLHIAEIASDYMAVKQGESALKCPKESWDTENSKSIEWNASFLTAKKVREIVQGSRDGIRDGSGTVLDGDIGNLIIELTAPVRKDVQGKGERSSAPVPPRKRHAYSRQRLKFFEETLIQAVHQLHDEFLSGDESFSAHRRKPLNLSDAPHDDWHSEFQLDSITVPDTIQALERCQPKEEKHIGNGDREHPLQPPGNLCRFVGCRDCTKMNTKELLKHLKEQEWYQGQVVHVEQIPPRPASFSSLDIKLPTQVANALQSSGIKRFFNHQALAINTLLASRNVVVATSTASGKSLCYNVPVLEALTKNRDACALFIFPTKALAQDQLRALRQICAVAFGHSAPSIEVYDGDTPFESRESIRKRVQLLITNPDMLHLSILPVHESFARFLSNLKFVIMDEGHAYKGVFGCHSAMVLRRLRRICNRKHGVSPRFVMTSATIGNPEEHIKHLIGIDSVDVVVADGSPHGPKDFVLWNPPLHCIETPQKASNEKLSKHRKQERDRHYKREANQIRSRGSQLSEPRGMTQAEWIQAIAISKKRGILDGHQRRNIGPDCQPSEVRPSTEDIKEEDSIGKESLCSQSKESCPPSPKALAALKSVDVRHHGASRPLIVKGTKTSTALQNLSEEAENRMPGPEWKGRSGTAGVTDDKRRDSPIVEISMLLAECIQHDLRTIAFCMTRKLCELVLAYTREILRSCAPHLVDSLKVYRAGYTPEERRKIEAELFNGGLRAVAATNALELGIDVGDLDATLHLGYPGSTASLWQQSGRAGRREQPSISIYVAFDGPLDQFFMHHPHQLFSQAVESVQVDAANFQILKEHIVCAAHEIPIEKKDEEFFGDAMAKGVNSLAKEGVLSRPPRHGPTCGIWKYSGKHSNPAGQVSLRAIDPEKYTIFDEGTEGRILEEIEESKVFFQIYGGAVYMFQGRTYLCTKLDLDKKIAFVRAADLKYYTSLRDFTDIHVTGSSVAYPVKVPRADFPTTSAAYADALVTQRFLGFYRVWRGSEIAFDSVDLFLPDVQFETQAAYIRVPHSLRGEMRKKGLDWRSGLHGANHALINVVPLFLMCCRGDMQTECANPYDMKYRPERILLYDNHPGGIGLAGLACPMFGVLLSRAYELVKDCPCNLENGCPGCVQHAKCGEYNTLLCKKGAEFILRGVLIAEGCSITD